MRAMSDPVVERTVEAYYDYINKRRLDDWISLFHTKAVCHDPVGSPPAQGTEGLREIWNMLTAPFSTLQMSPDDVFFAGSGAAVKWSGEGNRTEQQNVEFEGITIFEVDEKGKILTVMAYWDPAELMIRLAGED